MGPRIVCLDLDCFFVSVERLLDPTLMGKPVVVGASPGQRGVVTAASYEVRALGVKAGMPISEAARRAPRAIYLPPRHGVYAPYAKQVRGVLERFTPEVQTASIDEFYLDFRGTEALWRRPGDASDDATVLRVVRAMREAIQAEVGLPASAGLGTGRAVAKIASNRAKPAGVFQVPAGGERAFLEPLPVRAFPGIGPAAEGRLAAAGIRTLGQLLALPPGPERAEWGRLVEGVARAAGGEQEALGRDRPAFFEHDEGGSVGSISNERTFHADVGDERKVIEQLRGLSERVCWRARRRGVAARTVTLKLRTADFHTLQRGSTAGPTSDEAEVFRRVQGLLAQAWSRRLPVRLVGVQLSNLVAEHQLELPWGGRPKVGAAIDAVRERFGYDAIRVGALGRSRWQGEAS